MNSQNASLTINSSKGLWLKHHALASWLGFTTLTSFLFLVALFLISPTKQYTHATQTDMTVDVPTVVSLSATTPDAINISDSTTFYTTSTTVTANTNSEGGYTLTMASNDPNSTDLINQDTTTTIPSIDSAITIDATGSNFTTNRWAYHSPLHATDSYNPIPANNSAETIASADQAVSGDTSTVTFGVKASSSLPAGEYKNTVVFSIIAKEKPKDLSKATYLQDLATHPEYCANTTIATADNYADVTYTLKDSRDQKEYRVRKLKDGNCWMIDDLSIAGVTVTSADTDMESGSYELPDALASGGSYSYTEGYIWQNTGSFAGKYLYNWHAATVSSVDVTTITSGNASSSVCPKGWKLPSGGLGDQSFYKLYNTSDYTSSANMRSTTNGGPEFTLAGRWSNGYGSQGSSGRYWSRTAYRSNSIRAYNLYLDSSSVYPQDNDNKNCGFSVRCVTS